MSWGAVNRFLFKGEKINALTELVLQTHRSRADAALEKGRLQGYSLEDLIILAAASGQQAQAAMLSWLVSVADIDYQRSGDISVIAKFTTDFNLASHPDSSHFYGVDIFFQHDPAKSSRIKQAKTLAQRDRLGYKRWQLERSFEIYAKYNQLASAQKQKTFFESIQLSLKEQLDKVKLRGDISREHIRTLDAAAKLAGNQAGEAAIRITELKADLISLGCSFSLDAAVSHEPIKPDELIAILQKTAICTDSFPKEILQKKLNTQWSLYRLEESLKGPWVYVFGLSIGWPQLIKPVFSMERKGDLSVFELTPAVAELMIERQRIEFLEAAKRYRQEKAHIETLLPRLRTLQADIADYVLVLDNGLKQIKKITDDGGLPPSFIVSYADKLGRAKEARNIVNLAVSYEMQKLYAESLKSQIKILRDMI